jgi:diguanylate cyclase (GGDEF)-like protein
MVYAMKMLLPRTGEELSERVFRREAALLASVNDPGLVRAYEVGIADGRPYLVMEFVDGPPLTSLIATGPMPIADVVGVGIDVAGALDAAHQARLVHRDIKPDNIIVGADGVRVIDFGLAVRPGDHDGSTVAGTLLYAAPEQVGTLHRPVDGRADLYSLGAVLYECLTGVAPFVSRDVGELLRLHATATPPDPRALRPLTPPALAAIIEKLLAKDPDDRYLTAAGLVADLRRVTGGATEFRPGADDHPPARRDLPLIGRDDELAELVRRWRRARAGEGGVVLIRGSAGSGKSRLVRELYGPVRAAGGLVLVCECEPEPGLPLAPLRRAVDEYLAGVAGRPTPARADALGLVRAAAGPAATLLGAFSPVLAEVLSTSGLASENRDEQFSVAVADFIAALMTAAPGSLLHLDDVQWIDPATLRVLRHLAERLTASPPLIVLTARDDPASVAMVAQARSAIRQRLDLSLGLPPLPPSAVGQLISAYTGGLVVDPRIAASLAVRSDGNTFTLLSYLDAMLDAGLLRPDWGTWRLDPDDLSAVDLSAGMDAIVDRFNSLDPRLRHILGVAAVCGSIFDHRVVAAACDLPPEDVLDIAGVAVWRNVVERRPGGHFAFLHDRIREAVLDQFDPATLRSTHQRIADALAAAASTDAEAVFALARHSLLGEPDRDPGQVFRACSAAGRLALARYAPTEALGYLDDAAQAAQRAGLALDSGFLTAQATAQLRTGAFADAIRTARAAHALATDPIEQARILHLLADALGAAWQLQPMSEAALAALDGLGRPVPKTVGGLLVSTLRTFLLGQLCRLTRVGYGTAQGRAREVFECEATLYATAAPAFALQLQPLRALLFTLRQMYPVTRTRALADEARMRSAMAFAAMTVGLRRLSRRNARRAMAAVVDLGDPVLIAQVAVQEALLRHTYGIDQGESLHKVLTEHGRWLDDGVLANTILVLTWDALQRGDLNLARQFASRHAALRAGAANPEPAAAESGTRTAAQAAMASLLAWQGRAEEAAAMLAAADDPALPAWERLPIVGAALVVAYEGYQFDEAWDRAVDQFDGLKLPIRILLPVGWGYYLIRALGRLEQCRRATGADRIHRLGQAREAVRSLRRVATVPLLRAHYEVVRASLLQVEGEPRKALTKLAAAEPVLYAVDAPAIAFQAARVRAHALLDLAIMGEAQRQAQTALEIADEHGWPIRVRHIRAEFALDPSTADAPAGTDSIVLHRFQERLTAIEQVGLAASTVLDPDALAAIALDETVRILGAERAFLFLAEESGQRLVPHGGRDHHGNDLHELVDYSASTVEHVRSTRQPIAVTGADNDGAPLAASIERHGLRSILVAPVQLDGRLLGVVYLDSRVAKGIFTLDDVGVLVAITNHIAVTLETTRSAQLEMAVTAANRQRDLAATLRDALAHITGALEPDPHSVLVRLGQTALAVVGGERVLVVLAEGSANPAHVFAGAGQPSIVDLGPVMRQLLTNGSTTVGAEPAARPELLGAEDRSWLAQPFALGQNQTGLLLLASIRPNAYDGQAELPSGLVGAAVAAYHNAQRYAELRQLATIDDLTGVANRRYFLDLATKELARCRRSGAGLIALMVDIDHFKHINDEHGHPVGDDVIRAVSSRLNRCLGGRAIVGRYGGEEFALLVPADDQDLRATAELIRAAIADHPIATRSGVAAVTISVGASTLRPDDADAPTLLERADRRLYEAKRAGRNRVATD